MKLLVRGIEDSVKYSSLVVAPKPW